MGQLRVAHYETKKIALIYLAALLLLVLLVLTDGQDVTYTRFLFYPPGVYLLWISMAWVAGTLVWRLPYFLRAVFRIPALEYDGQTLILRGWETHRIRSEDLPNTQAKYSKGGSIEVRPPYPAKPIRIDLRYVRAAPATSLIESLTLRPIARL